MEDHFVPLHQNQFGLLPPSIVPQLVHSRVGPISSPQLEQALTTTHCSLFDSDKTIGVLALE